jgi:hypothetical protein
LNLTGTNISRAATSSTASSSDTIWTLEVQFQSQVRNILIDKNTTIAGLRNLIGQEFGISTTITRRLTLLWGDIVLTLNTRKLVKTCLVNNAPIKVTIPGTGGGIHVKKDIVKQKQTKINDRLILLQQLGTQVPDNVKTLDAVKTLGTNIMNFIKMMHEQGAMVALADQAMKLHTQKPDQFKEMLNYLQSSGSNNPSTKLKAIANTFFMASELEAMKDGIEQSLTATNHTLSVAFDKAIMEASQSKKAFTIPQFVNFLQNVVVASSSASSSTGVAVGADEDMDSLINRIKNM